MRKMILTVIFTLMMSAIAAAATVAPTLSAESAILVESSTGRVIYEKNADFPRPPASMTKMLTSILCIEWLSPEAPIKFSSTAAYTEDSTFLWTPGDELTAADLNKAMMLVSDNGGAVAIAQAIGGSISTFSEMMNVKALEIGCENSHFANPNGLPNSDHYSTARDMAKIAIYCMRNPEFREIVATKKFTFHWQNVDKKDEAENTNELLYDDKFPYDGANGIKTGWTRAAGGCLAASAKRGNTELIAIIMHSRDIDTRFDDARKLLDYGFESVKMTRVLNKDRVEKVVFVEGGRSATVTAGPEEDLNFPLLDGEDKRKLQVRYSLPKITQAKVSKGQVLGSAVLNYNGKEVARIPLTARENVERGFSVSSTLVGVMSPIISVAQNVLGALLA